MKKFLLMASILILVLSNLSCDLLSSGNNPPSPPDKPGSSVLRDYEYADRRIFDLGLPRDNLNATDIITKLIMYESVPNYRADTINTIANFYVDPDDTSLFKSESVQEVPSKVLIIPSDTYTIENDTYGNMHYIVFDSRHSRNINLGYYMEVTDTLGNIRTFGNTSDTLIVTDTVFTTFDTLFYNKNILHLKLLYPADWTYPTPSNQTWQLMWRNCYEAPIGIELNYLNLTIYKGLEGYEDSLSSLSFQGDSLVQTDEFLEILGLDLSNNNYDINLPDGLVDDRNNIYNADLGLLIFPSRTPFFDTIRYRVKDREIPELDSKVHLLYYYNSWTERTEASQYFIKFEWLEY